ncbi:MFS sugar transporter-like protein [Penicillium malachiteum]|nr:MFS sugar transporter-like protein [Penicillium malachiteum]
MTVFHRRTIMLGGITFAGLLFFSMGVAASIPIQTSASIWCVAVCLQMIWLTIGPVVGPAMATAGEVSAVKLKAETLALGFLFAHLWSTVWNIVVPYMYTSDEVDLGGKTGWIFFATSIIGLIIVWYEFPETKGLTFGQIDSIFEMRIPARNFLQGGDEDPDSLEAAKMDSVE